MRRLIGLALVAVVVLAGCGGGLKNKVVGTWKFDSKSVEMPGLTPEIKNSPMFAEQMKGLDSARIEFKSDGTYSGTGMGDTGTGKWTLEDHTIKITEDKGDNKNLPTLTLSEDGSKIKASGPAPSGQGQMTMDLIKA